MARYRKMDVRTWGDAKFKALTPIPPCGQGLWFYLLTNPETTAIPGLYRSGEAAMAEALNWPLKAFREAFLEVSEQAMAKADWGARLVWVPKAIRHNPPESPNVIRNWRLYWDELPECGLKLEAFQTLKDFVKGLSEGFQKAFREACPEPSPKAMANQEQEQEQEQDLKTSMSADADVGLLLETWNRQAPPEFAKCETLGGKRRKPAKELLQVVSLDRWSELIAKAKSSTFCMGGGNDGWRLSLPSMLKRPEIALRVLEGTYGGHQRPKNGAYNPPAKASDLKPGESRREQL